MEAAESISRTSVEYHAGHAAYHADKKEPECPYRRGNKKRVGWWTGWYDADVQEHLGEIFERYGLTYP